MRLSNLKFSIAISALVLATVAGSNAMADDTDFVHGPLNFFEQDSSSYDSRKDPWLKRLDKPDDARMLIDRPRPKPKQPAEFSKQSFVDLDFGRHDFTDLLIHKREDRGDYPKRFADTEGREKDSDDDLQREPTDDILRFNRNGSIYSVDDADSEPGYDLDRPGILNDDDRKSLMKLRAPIPGMLHDWVPDRVDPLDNGGFALSPFNGSPVPYRLNGHIGIERGLPWKAHD